MILCAALKILIRDKDGDIDNYIVIPCHRHHEGFAILTKLNMKLYDEARSNGDIVQGFISTDNNFYNREEALKEFLSCGQASAEDRQRIKVRGYTKLYSEDLY